MRANCCPVCRVGVLVWWLKRGGRERERERESVCVCVRDRESSDKMEKCFTKVKENDDKTYRDRFSARH